MDWKFSTHDVENALEFYTRNGFVGFTDVMDGTDIRNLRQAFREAVESGRMAFGEENPVDANDVIYRHELFEEYAKDARLIALVKKILGDKGLVLQHSKMNSKPLRDNGSGLIDWHQDYPFFPHTNLDLIAVGIHIDDEDETSGSLRFVPGSHKMGVLSHCSNGEFMYRCTDERVKNLDSILLTCPAGTVTIHHCLTLHQSDPKRNDHHRRLLVYEYRADDNIQLGGVIHKCTGYEITPPRNKGMVRFLDGTTVENRGTNGRLYDVFAKLAPNQ